MERGKPLRVQRWDLGECPCCDQKVATLQAGNDGPGLTLRPTKEQAAWLVRARHPTYFKRTEQLLETLKKQILQVELQDCGDGVLAPIATAWWSEHLQPIYLSIGPALLLTTRTAIPFFIDAELISRHPPTHYDELQVAFGRFVDQVPPRSFGLRDKS
jgi:hypothetical protein